MGGAPDGVVEVYLLPGSNKPDKTKVIKSTTDPVFNDNFQFQVDFYNFWPDLSMFYCLMFR